MTAPPQLHRTEVEGVPAVWSDVPGPLRAGLVFRVGLADETLPRSGVTHLVEHLAIAALDDTTVGGGVELLGTSFDVWGGKERVVAALEALCAALADLPVGRLPTEARILTTEAASRGPGLEHLLLHLRYGARGPGLPALQELGLRGLDGEDVRSWASECFVRQNAALWLTGAPPGSLRLPLADGQGPRALADPEPAPRRRFPAEAPGLSGGVGVAAVAPTWGRADVTPALLAQTLEVAGHRRLRAERGLSYDVDGRARGIGRSSRHLRLIADCRDEHAATVRDELLGTWRDVADGRHVAEGRRSAMDLLERVRSEPEAQREMLKAGARWLLAGEQPYGYEEALERMRATDDAAVSALARRLLDDLLVVTPEGTPPRFDDPVVAAPPVDGRRHQLRRVPKHLMAGVELVVGDAGVSLVADDRADTVRFDEVAAAVGAPGGGLDLIGTDGTVLPLDPRDFRDGDEALAAIEARVPPDPRVPLDPRAAHVEAVATRQLKRRWAVGESLDLVWERLADDEEIRVLAEASRGVRGGVLAVTDRRVLWITKILEERVHAWPRDRIRRASGRDVGVAARLRLSLDGDDDVTLWISPRGRLRMILDELQ
jgi:zinc protease